MKKYIFALVFVLALAVVSTASAANVTNIKFANEQTQASCVAGESVNVTFRVTIPTGEVVELGQVDVIGDNLAPELPVSLGGELGLQEGQVDITTSVVCPQNTGYYSVQYRTAGIYGGQKAVLITDGVTASATFNNALRVVASGSNSTSGSTAPSWMSEFQAALAKLAEQVAKLTASVTPGVGGPSTTTQPTQLCNTFKSLSAQYPYGSTNAYPLQSFLIANGFSIPAGPTGNHLSQTASASASFRAAYTCY